MARTAQMIIPGVAHHVTQGGNRRERIFFEPDDEQVYLDLMAVQLKRYGVECWGYCLKPNHVHYILVPSAEVGLARAVGEAYRRYTGFVGARGRWTGHLFQGRCGSVAMDEDHLMAAFRYVALNPVKAKLVEHAEDRPWSSAKAYVDAVDTAYVVVNPALSRVGDFKDYLDIGPDAETAWANVLKAEIGRSSNQRKILDRGDGE